MSKQKTPHPQLTADHIVDIITIYQRQVNDFTNVTADDIMTIKNKFNYKRY